MVSTLEQKYTPVVANTDVKDKGECVAISANDNDINLTQDGSNNPFQGTSLGN